MTAVYTFIAEERFRELGVERAETADAVYAAADFLTIHLPKTPETEGWLNAEVFAKCKDGVRVLNVARGPLVVDADGLRPFGLAAQVMEVPDDFNVPDREIEGLFGGEA